MDMDEYTIGILIHFGELALKGKNRNVFIEQLVTNIQRKTGGKVKKYRDRLFLTEGDKDALSFVYGISWYAKATKLEKNIDKIKINLFRIIEENLNNIKTFGLQIKRADKSFKPDSQVLASMLGKEIKDRFNFSVDLKNPDLNIFIEIADEVFIHTNREKGLGGMPIGIGGKILSLLSGGIDSPVASCQMIKRGAEVDFLHFHAFNSNQKVIDSKIVELAKIITRYQVKSRIYIASYNEFQKELLKHKIENGYELVLFRRFIVKFAEFLAEKENYNAICTGDSLSQVASQTIENIESVLSNVSVPVFQPLISMDKLEIIQISKNIGSYETSIQQYKECCSLLSKNPKTKTRKNIIERYEGLLNFEEIIQSTYKSTDIIQIH